MDLLLGQVSKGDRASGGRGTKKELLHEVCDFVQQLLCRQDLTVSASPYAAPISLSSETALRPFSLER